MQEVVVPEVLYEEVIEVDERVVLKQDGCQLPRKDPKRIVTGVKHFNLTSKSPFKFSCGSVVSRPVFQSGGWRFNLRPSRCVLEQDT